MQFFPALESNGTQSFRTGGFPETTELRNEQGFADVLSVHLEHPASFGGNEPAAGSTGAGETHARVAESHERQAFTSEGESGETESRAASGAETTQAQQAGESGASVPPAAEKAAGKAEWVDAAAGEQAGASVDKTESEKKPEEKAAAKDAKTDNAAAKDAKTGDASAKDAKAADSAAKDAEAAAAGTGNVAPLADMLATVLELAASVEGGSEAETGASAGNGTQIRQDVRTRIAALRQIVEQLQAAAPEERSAIASTLGEQLRGLKEALVSASAEKAAAGKSETRKMPAEGVSQGAAGTNTALAKAVQLIDRISAALETEIARDSGGKTAAPRRQQSVSAPTVKAGAGEAIPAGEREVERRTVRVQGDTAGSAALQADAAETKSAAASGSASGQPGSESAHRGEGRTEAKAGSTVDAASAAGEEGGAQAARGGDGVKVVEAGDGRAEALLETSKPRVREATRDAKTSTERSAVRDSLAAREAVAGTKADVAMSVESGRGEAISAETAGPLRDGGGARQRNDAKEGFFSSQGGEKRADKAAAASAARNASDTQNLTQTVAEALQPQARQGETSATVRSADVYRQVENGAFKNLGQGVKQLVIRLDPAELGQVSVILQVKGKEVQAVLRTSSQETTQVLNEHVSQLKTQLESQGLKVTRLEVQTQLADSQTQSQWQGAEQHNRYQESRELAMTANRWRSMGRGDADLVRDVQNVIQREKTSQGGVDIFA